jgi:macrolide transport system ATP-binding/permease protein
LCLDDTDNADYIPCLPDVSRRAFQGGFAVSVPLIELTDIRKSYGGGEGEPRVEVLHGILLTIHAGEFVALIGASGSGKSTLMHILGCLDKPTSGAYRFAGRDISAFSADELAWLRREAFGFVFQGYHLIRALDARHNVQVPAVYAGTPPAQRMERAAALLERLGLSERAGHRPHQLSGGQQQRVSIARALMNGGHVILADEPTGALDSKSGAEVMALLKELARAGHTVLLITHDPQVAAQAHRVIRISDGQIQESGGTPPSLPPPVDSPPAKSLDPQGFMARMARSGEENASWLADVQEAVASAWRTLFNNRFRTLLTLLGIMIGVASVIVLMAVGQGASEKLLEKLSAWGSTHRISIWPDSGDTHGLGGQLFYSDAALLREVENVAHVSPFGTGSVMLRAGNADARALAYAINGEGLDIFHWKMARGVFFNREDERQLTTVIVLGKGIRQRLFGNEDAIGRYVLLDRVPFLVIGELAQTSEEDDGRMVVFPYETASRRIWGWPTPNGFQLRVRDPVQIEETIAGITQVLTRAHRMKDFRAVNNVARAQAENEAGEQQSLLLALIAGISLVVGGIGVMNIMLMAVKERTREIGIRMAVGARRRDIQRQFLTEAVMLSLVGGAIGVVIGLAIGAALLFWEAPVIFSVRAMLLAFGCALVTGLIFGYMPARTAARLDPVIALGGE